MRILMFLFISVLMYGFSMQDAIKIMDSNNTKKILDTLNSKNGVELLEIAVYKDREDIINMAIKHNFDFNRLDSEGSNVLSMAAFIAKPKYVKLLIDKANPNQVDKRGRNALASVLTGLNQEYSFVLSDRFVKTDMNKTTYEKFKQKIKNNILETINILKENGAVSEYPKDYYSSANMLSKMRKIKNKFLIKVLLKYFNNKQKFIYYVVTKQYNKAKEFVTSHPEIMKTPYFIDSKKHFLWFLAILDDYEFAKWLLAKYPNIVNLKVYGVFSQNPFFDGMSAKFRTLYEKYALKKTPLKEVIKAIDDKNYKLLDKITKNRFFNVYSYDYYVYSNAFTPLVYAMFKDTKAMKILLKNGARMSGFNEIHYAILEDKKLPLNYKKWTKIYKLNEGDTLNDFTPLTLAIILKKDELIDELIKQGSKVRLKDFKNSIYSDRQDKILPYIHTKIPKYILVELVKNKKFKTLQTIKNRKLFYKESILDAYETLQKVSKNYPKFKPIFEQFTNIFKDELTTKSTKEEIIEKCKKSLKENINKEICQKAVKFMYKDDTFFANYIALKIDRADLIDKSTIQNTSVSFKFCYYLATSKNKAINFYHKYKKLNLKCYIKTPKLTKTYQEILPMLQ